MVRTDKNRFSRHPYDVDEEDEDEDEDEDRGKDKGEPPQGKPLFSIPSRGHIPSRPQNDGNPATIPSRPDTTNSVRRHGLPHESSEGFASFCNIKLGAEGYSYILCQNRWHQAFLAYPISKVSEKRLTVQRKNIQMAQHQNILKVDCTFTRTVNGDEYNFAACEVMYLSMRHIRQSRFLSDVCLASLLRPV